MAVVNDRCSGRHETWGGEHFLLTAASGRAGRSQIKMYSQYRVALEAA